MQLVQLDPQMVGVLEIILLIIVAIGWYYGARIMNYRLHHLAVYSVTLVHLIIVTVWMIPIALIYIQIGALSNPIVYWRHILHFSAGILADVLAVILCLMFLARRDMPLSLLRRGRPMMISTVILWTISAFSGFLLMF